MNNSDVLKNQNFWLYFLSTAFPNAIDDSGEQNLGEFIAESFDCSEAVQWSDRFTGYDSACDNDGYSDNPAALYIALSGANLKIEFHPADTVYFLDDREIGCTGGEFSINKISFESFLSYTKNLGALQAFLLLPMAFIKTDEISSAKCFINTALKEIPISEKLCGSIPDMIANGLLT